MLKSLKTALSHEDLYVERYDRLLSWALQLTDRDREQAEDLLHDAFVHFTLVRPDLSAINHLDNYLLTILKNLHLSQIRRAMRSAHGPRSLVDFDSLRIGLRAEDLRAKLQIHDELRLICHYACVRKETSKAGSVLILRFFRGYYPTELAQILRTPRQVVDTWLRLARREAKAYLEDPRGVTFMPPGGVVEMKSPSAPHNRDADLFAELTSLLLEARTGECFTREQLQNLYCSREPESIDCQALSHVVSCSGCLDRVNALLGLPSLAERNPFERLGPGPRSKGSSGGEGGSGGSAVKEFVSNGKEQARETFEHRPEQLLFSANGFLLSSIAVDHERNEHSLNINLDEKISFVEVFSEQGVRLLLMNIDPPPNGLGEQTSQVNLSDGRNLKLTLSFSDHWPVLHSIYCDPLLSEAGNYVEEKSQTSPTTATVTKTFGPNHLKTALSTVYHGLLDQAFWLRPATVTAIVALIMLGLLIPLRLWRTTPVTTVADLLQRSAAAEESMAARSDQVLHRTITLEESVPGSEATGSTSRLISRRRIEVWQSAEKGIVARRLYDDRGTLVAGDWRRADGVQTLYHHGTRPQVRIPNPQTAILNFDDAWQLSPSAKEFNSLIGNELAARLQERGDVYVVTAESARSAESVDGLIRATLVLSRSDLHATEQTLIVRHRGEERSFHYLETSFERRPVSAVAPSVFEPDPVFVKSTTETKVSPESASPRPAIPTSPALATPDLEVEVLRLLNQAGADLDDETSVTRTGDGKLRITGLVETTERKAEILRSLAPVINNAAVKVDISTVAEALAQRQGQRSSQSIVVEGFEADANSFPTYAELRTRFSDEEARAFASRMVSSSRQAMRHAWAVKGLVNQFSAEDLRTLSPEARSKWLSLVRNHARAFGRETGRLRQQLEPIFLAETPSGGGERLTISNDAELAQAVAQLFQSAQFFDQLIRAAFSISASGTTANSIKSEQFWRALRVAERAAADISVIQISSQ